MVVLSLADLRSFRSVAAWDSKGERSNPNLVAAMPTAVAPVTFKKVLRVSFIGMFHLPFCWIFNDTPVMITSSQKK
jgi:hypothetical protein